MSSVSCLERSAARHEICRYRLRGRSCWTVPKATAFTIPGGSALELAGSVAFRPGKGCDWSGRSIIV